jgi:hypothetical protein
MLATVLVVGLIVPGSETGRLLLNSDEFDLSEIPTRKLSIPISLGAADRRAIDRLELYISEDGGKTWSEYANCLVEDREFQVDIEVWPAGRTYWFGVRVVMKDGTVQPPEIGKIRKELSLRVDGTAFDFLKP